VGKTDYEICTVAGSGTGQIRFTKLENPSIEGIEYQQGTLAGYTCSLGSLEHWGNVYIVVPRMFVTIEHIHPKSKGGTNRFNNLALACTVCNQRKGNQSRSFLSP